MKDTNRKLTLVINEENDTTHPSNLNENEGYSWTFFDQKNAELLNVSSSQIFRTDYKSIIIRIAPIKECDFIIANITNLLTSKLTWCIKTIKYVLANFNPMNITFVCRLADRNQRLNFMLNNAIFSLVEGIKLETQFLKWSWSFYMVKNFHSFTEIKKINPDKKNNRFVYFPFSINLGLYLTNRGWKVPHNQITNDWKLSDLINKVCIVTGASGGIGLKIAQSFCNSGCKVYSLSRSVKNDEKIHFLKCDVGSYENIQQNIDLIIKKEKRLDFLVNNSGYGIAGPIEETDIDEFVNMLRINFFAQIFTINSSINHLKNNHGVIFNIGSMGGIFSIPFQVLYSVSKNLIDSYTELISSELNAMGINVCNIMPGDTKSNFGKHRQKFLLSNRKYKKIFLPSLSKMEKLEKNGHSPQKIADLVKKTLLMKKIPLKTTVGKYRFFFWLGRLLSFKKILKVLEKVFIKKIKSRD